MTTSCYRVSANAGSWVRSRRCVPKQIAFACMCYASRHVHATPIEHSAKKARPEAVSYHITAPVVLHVDFIFLFQVPSCTRPEAVLAAGLYVRLTSHVPPYVVAAQFVLVAGSFFNSSMTK